MQKRKQPATTGWNGVADQDRSPYCDFPRDGRITETPFAGLVAEHAPKGSDPDTVGKAYAEYQRRLSPRLLERPAGVSHQEDFVAFCKAWSGDLTPA